MGFNESDHEIMSSTPKRMTTDDKLDAVMQKLLAIDLSIAELRSTLAVTFHDEFSPERQRMSNLLADKVTDRLRGEFLAREATAPTGAWWCYMCNTAHVEGFICKDSV
jgi:hypothetical protein